MPRSSWLHNADRTDWDADPFRMDSALHSKILAHFETLLPPPVSESSSSSSSSSSSRMTFRERDSVSPNRNVFPERKVTLAPPFLVSSSSILSLSSSAAIEICLRGWRAAWLFPNSYYYTRTFSDARTRHGKEAESEREREREFPEGEEGGGKEA